MSSGEDDNEAVEMRGTVNTTIMFPFPVEFRCETCYANVPDDIQSSLPQGRGGAPHNIFKYKSHSDLKKHIKRHHQAYPSHHQRGPQILNQHHRPSGQYPSRLPSTTTTTSAATLTESLKAAATTTFHQRLTTPTLPHNNPRPLKPIMAQALLVVLQANAPRKAPRRAKASINCSSETSTPSRHITRAMSVSQLSARATTSSDSAPST